MVTFDIRINQLEVFNVDVLQWKRLDNLDLSYNKLKRFDQNGIWTHPNLAYLDVSDNVGFELPNATTDIVMPSLLYFGCRNNSVDIHLPFDNIHFPNLFFLYLNGNYLMEFPDKSLKETVQYLGVARCYLKSLPSYLAEFKNLKYIDARDNNISTVNDDLKMLINSNEVENYFSGNTVCKTDETLECEELCSKYCPGKYAFGNNVCEDECNTVECKHDHGDCL
jgi:Leucine-rich repeat (LRR) protein